MTHVVAIDFECAGGVPSMNGFTQFGAVLMRISDSKVLARFDSYANMEGYEWESRCVREFWEQYPERYADTLKHTKDAPLSPHDVIAAFHAWLLKETVGIDDVYIITDNGAFDSGCLKAFSKVDTLYLFNGKYRDHVDVNCVYLGMYAATFGKVITTALTDASAKQLALDVLNKPIMDEIEKHGRWFNAEMDDDVRGDIKKTMLELQLKLVQKPVFNVTKTHHPVEDAEEIASFYAFFLNYLSRV